MPESAENGNYTLHVVGTTSETAGAFGILFQNETKLEFQSKHISVFILTDKFMVNKRQTGKKTCPQMLIEK